MPVLSICVPYTRYGKFMSVSRWKMLAHGWLYSVDHASPPFSVTLPPPSLPSIMRRLLRGSIHRSWWSPCGVLYEDHVFPPSIDFHACIDWM